MRARHAIDAMVVDEMRHRRAAAHPGDDILGWLLEAQADPATALSDEEVLDQTISLVAASYDTTASAIGWIALHLAEQPGLRAAVRAELRDVTNGHPLSIEHLPALRLAAAVVSEVLRLNPPALVSVRYIVGPFELHGHTIPNDRLLMHSSYITQMDRDQFPDPTAFDRLAGSRDILTTMPTIPMRTYHWWEPALPRLRLRVAGAHRHDGPDRAARPRAR